MGRRTGIHGGGTALFRLVRFWARRWVLHAAGSTAERARVRHLLLLEAVDAAARGGDVSISDVATELGIDRSGASRLAKEAEAAGYVCKAPSGEDARRAVLTLTAKGREVLEDARVWQEEVFADLVSHWPKAEAAGLASGLRRLAAEVPPTTPREEKAR